MVPGLATKNYRPRIVDSALASALSRSGAVEIKGPKWCGKTEVALQAASSALMMQDPDEGENNLLLAQSKPSLLLRGAKVDCGVMGPPSFCAVLVPGGYAYRRPDGVLVIPITCLRD